MDSARESKEIYLSVKERQSRRVKKNRATTDYKNTGCRTPIKIRRTQNEKLNNIIHKQSAWV